MKKNIDEILQIENAIPLPDNKKIPIPVGIISILSLLYYAYSIRETAIILQISGINLLFLVALIISIAGLCFAIGILFLKKIALYGYTLVWVINFGFLIIIGYFNLWFFIAYIISLVVIWNYKSYFENKNISTLESSHVNEIENDTKINIIDSENKHHSKDQINTLISKIEVVIIKTRTIKINEKYIVVMLTIWSFIHTYLLLKSFSFPNNPFIESKNQLYLYRDLFYMTKSDIFYPFTNLSNEKAFNRIKFHPEYFDLRFYDYTEYFVYAVGVWVAFILYKYLRSRK